MMIASRKQSFTVLHINPKCGRSGVESMKVGGLLRAYHPARKCLKTEVG